MITVAERIIKSQIPLIDNWIPDTEDVIFGHTKGMIVANISPIYGLENGSSIDYFIMTAKRCYNSDTKTNPDGTITTGFREHNTLYLNYFEKYFDRDRILFGIYGRIKYCIDYFENYSESNLIDDLTRYIIDHEASPILHYQLMCMTRYNYHIESSYTNTRNPCLEYTDEHSRILMEISMIQNMMIPILAHFVYLRKYSPSEIKRILLTTFDRIFIMTKAKYGVNMYAKLWATTSSYVSKSAVSDSLLWDMQDIRGRNTTIHAMATIEDLMVQIMPKYVYNKSVVCFNFNAIKGDIKYKVVEVPYEFSLTTVSSSNRDDDNNSESDKFEAHMTKQDESMLLQINVNATSTMRKIIQEYGPFYREEIEFYRKSLTADGKPLRNEFQANLVSYLFQRYFYDAQAVRMINNDEYIILMIAAKRKLILNGQKLLPFIIGGKIERLITRKIINKKIQQRIEISDNYPKVVAKYRNIKIQEQNIFKIIAQILASDFRNIDFFNSEFNGIIIPKKQAAEIICEEILTFALMI